VWTVCAYCGRSELRFRKLGHQTPIPKDGGGDDCAHQVAEATAERKLAFECTGLACVASISRFPDSDGIPEIFVSNSKAGSHCDSAAKDCAVVASIALQFGIPLNVIRHAVLRDGRGRAAGPLGMALDILAERND
jgi:hypothetical protein